MAIVCQVWSVNISAIYMVHDTACKCCCCQWLLLLLIRLQMLTTMTKLLSFHSQWSMIMIIRMAASRSNIYINKPNNFESFYLRFTINDFVQHQQWENVFLAKKRKIKEKKLRKIVSYHNTIWHKQTKPTCQYMYVYMYEYV